jgi:hypothetical protein
MRQNAGQSVLRYANPNHWQRESGTRGIMAWVLVMSLLVAVVMGSYVGASYLANRLFAVELPQMSMPEIGFPEINLPNIELDVPEWLSSGSEQGDILIVNINAGLNMRDAPGLDTQVITVLPNGTRVQKLEGPVIVDDVPWVRVRVVENESVDGWLSLNFLQPAE